MNTKFDLNIGEKEIIIETGKMARQANGAVTITCGETVVFVAVVMSRKPRLGISFFPLTVEYQEKTYASGRIPGGFFKREGRPTEREILCARLIDRPIRPLFPDGMINEVQIMAMVLSSDGVNDPDILALIGASTALSISDVPFLGPVGTVRVGRKAGEFIINPTYAEINEIDLDITVCATREGIIMVEADCCQVGEDIMAQAMEYGFKQAQLVIELQDKMAKECGKPKQQIELSELDESLIKQVKDLAAARLSEINSLSSKEERIEMMTLLSKELVEKLVDEEGEITEADIDKALYKVEQESVRDMISVGYKRVDGRRFDEVRQIECVVGLLPRTHGSAVFTRGQTQSLAVTTLGTSADEQMVEALEGEMQKSFMLHYNFPPFSVGEVKPVRGPGRREIGHGALAERALKAVMPSKEEFPYTVRVVSDILESNGSSSMATACAGSLSLMDAGVPVKKPVAGIALGLVKQDVKNFVILTDIAGVEDHYGDMDFKVAGTRDGITAMQVDVKLGSGITMEMAVKALAEAKKARIQILDKMDQAIRQPRESISQYAPHITTIKVSTEKIGDIIGPGGKTIKKIIADTGATIDIDDDGTVSIASTDEAATKRAVEIISRFAEEPEVGKIYNATVKKIMPFGAFCEILPKKEGLVHVSELSDKYVKNVDEVVKVGDEVKVKLMAIDDQGRLNLSIKKALESSKKEDNQSPPESA